ncbi:hypothetical protein B0A50_08786 [Salinomyces thailandicus]|uniref:Smr domain-containing protein n=1 Tax=Salinomyces thailandicus TaxID=706561 RepID=A0A4U0TIW4_9PEZI|nr:hypothetical protein B0A50_08786 [Salinomyces thailandica]
MGDAFATLEAEYCPPLDPALLSAIVSDYDLEDEESLQAAREILGQLRESAVLEEAAGEFDPSGLGGEREVGQEGQRAESCPERGSEETLRTDLRGFEDGFAALGLGLGDEEEGSIGDPEELESLDEETKVRLLRDLFGDRVSKYSVQHTLRKCNGKWQASMEELLNQVYFEEAEDSEGGAKFAAKGVEAFSEDNTVRRGRKGKRKGKRRRGLGEREFASLPSSPLETSPAPVANRWETAAGEIDFVASRTRIASATVASVYYEKGASVPQTIGALLKASMEESKALVTDDAEVATAARELGYDFPGLASEYLATIIRLTHPSTVAAHELAQALTTKPSRHETSGGIQILPRYAPPSLDDEVAWDTVTRPSRAVRPPSVNDEAPSASAQATAYASARQTAYAQASAAHRKAKSDRLMSGAAAYYSQVGRDAAVLSSRATAASADALAASQCSATQLDLHGIDVVNGVRIARERVRAWWKSVGERVGEGRGGAEELRAGGFGVVVGRGRHSEGGKGKLGPAVGKALREDGWRVENTGAVLVVWGKARR